MGGEGDAVEMRMRVPKQRQRRWLEAAVAAEQELADWIAAAADDAAESLLEPGSAASRPRAVHPALDPGAGQR